MITAIPEIVRQHADEIATMFLLRTANLAAPHIRLRDLRRTFDDRLAAHLLGLALAGKMGWAFCEAALESPTAGAMFTAAVRALKDPERQKLDRLIALSEALPETRPGLEAAFGWLERQELPGIVVTLLRSGDHFRRSLGIAACALHGVDPGLSASRLLSDDNPLVRARALRTAGENGCIEAMPTCDEAIHDENPECSFWAAWSAALLGNRVLAIDRLLNTGLAGGSHNGRAFRLGLQALGAEAAHNMLRSIAEEPSNRMLLIQGSGIAGDPAYVPWLIRQMVDERAARMAGEAFALITGANIMELSLDARPPEGIENGPSEDPNDRSVAMDLDTALPWPDTEKIEAWWNANASRFQKGTRYFMGQPVTREHCIDVLKNGYQRQRILAAHYLCLLEPGTPLFNTSAPAWRQQRVLAAM